MAEEPVTLEQVKMHLRLGSSDHEDAYLMILIAAARRAIENATSREIAVESPTLDQRDMVIVAQASLLIIADWYANREAVGEIPLSLHGLLTPLRVMFV
jgi:hypothetical protein